MDEGDTSFAVVATTGSIERLQIVNYVIVASMTILIYDYSLTLVDEVSFVWSSKLNIMKILYFLSRYVVFADVALTVYGDVSTYIPLNHCLPLNDALSWLTTFGIGFAEMILILRTYALWARNKKVLYGLSSLFLVFFIASLTITGIFLSGMVALPIPYPTYTGCYFAGGSPIIFFNFVMLIIFETVIVCMTAIRGFRKFRGARSPLVGTLYRDGIMFYFCLFIISLANVLVLSLGPNEFQDLITTFQRVMHSILSCRVVIHARRIDRKVNVVSLLPMQFVQREPIGSQSAATTTQLTGIDISHITKSDKSRSGDIEQVPLDVVFPLTPTS